MKLITHNEFRDTCEDGLSMGPQHGDRVSAQEPANGSGPTTIFFAPEKPILSPDGGYLPSKRAGEAHVDGVNDAASDGCWYWCDDGGQRSVEERDKREDRLEEEHVCRDVGWGSSRRKAEDL